MKGDDPTSVDRRGEGIRPDFAILATFFNLDCIPGLTDYKRVPFPEKLTHLFEFQSCLKFCSLATGGIGAANSANLRAFCAQRDPPPSLESRFGDNHSRPQPSGLRPQHSCKPWLSVLWCRRCAQNCGRVVFGVETGSRAHG